MRTHRSRTGLTADAFESLVVELIVRYIVFTDVLPDLLRAAVGQRVVFDEYSSLIRKSLIVLTQRDITAGRTLIPALTGNPGVQSFEMSP
jgi:hypothetical protein